MSDLQLSLLVLGIVIVAGVVIFNWWQEKRYQDAADASMQPTISRQSDGQPENEAAVDVLMRTPTEADFVLDPARVQLPDDTARPEAVPREVIAGAIEDAIDHYEQFSAHDSASQASIGLSQRLEEALADSEPVHSAQKNQLEELPAAVSTQVDLIAMLFLAQVTDSMEVISAMGSMQNVSGRYSIHLLDPSGVWHPLSKAGAAMPESCQRVLFSLQLADRSGPVSKDVLMGFQAWVDHVGHALLAQVEWMGDTDPLGYAQQLDQFCISVDQTVGFHLVHGNTGPFTGTKFRGLAEACGLQLGESGQYQSLNEQGQLLYTVQNQDAHPFNPDMLRTVVLRGVLFQLDIPRVSHCAEAFNQMVLVAKQMSTSLQAQLVDDHQRLLGDVQLEKIRHQLGMIQGQMVARGIVPGTPIALRLFS